MECRFRVEYINHGFQSSYVSLRKARKEAQLSGFDYQIYELQKNIWRLIEERTNRGD
jgi:hypothetical protein